MVRKFSTNIIISAGAIEMVISFPASVPLILNNIETFFCKVIGKFCFFSILKSIFLSFLWSLINISFFLFPIVCKNVSRLGGWEEWVLPSPPKFKSHLLLVVFIIHFYIQTQTHFKKPSVVSLLPSLFFFLLLLSFLFLNFSF